MSTAQVSRAVRRGPLTSLTAAAATLGLLGCSTGLDAQTNEPYDPGVGANQRAGTVDILGALVVADGDTGTVSATLVSDPGSEPAELTDVSASTLDGEGTIEVQVTGSFEVTPQTNTPQKLSDATADPGESATIVLSGDLAPGDFVEVAFTFSGVEPFEVQMPVVARSDDGTFDDVAQAPA